MVIFIMGITHRSSYTLFSPWRTGNMNKKDNIIQPNLRYRPYMADEVIRIVNPKQRDLYIKHNVYPVDIYPSVDKDGKDITVYIFLKEETQDLYQKWLDHTLE